MDETLELGWVSALLVEADPIALNLFRTAIEADDKGSPSGYDPVTAADRGIEELLRGRISDRFPEHEIVGEETGTSGPAGRYRWLIDPIDGTKAFVTGSPLWGILLGLLDNGRPIAGWMRQPYLGETFSAVDGKASVERNGARRHLATRRGSISPRRRCTPLFRACSPPTTIAPRSPD